MILTESSVHSILYLMFLFLYLTELTIILKMEFLALIFIIVYIGAVCVLMLFHIKLIKTFMHRFDNINNQKLSFPFLVVCMCLPFLQIFTLFFQSPSNEFEKRIKVYDVMLQNQETSFDTYNYYFNYISWIDIYDTFKSTQILGFLLYNFYFIYLIFGSFILLVAMVGSIFLTLKQKKNKKFQTFYKQIFTNLPERITFNKN